MKNSNVNAAITAEITRRARRLNTEHLCLILDRQPFYLAGGALGRDRPNDFDIYPACGNRFDFDKIKEAETHIAALKVVCKTRNAVTAELNGQTVQFCNYTRSSLLGLVESFDFAHCQVGAVFKADENGRDLYVVDDVAYTQDWLKAKALESTFFTGSDYPLASLLRTFKYVRRKMFTGKSYVNDVLAVVAASVRRGFEDYNDFKDQLDAIDIAYSGSPNAWNLFKAFWDRGLVKSRTGIPEEREEELK